MLVLGLDSWVEKHYYRRKTPQFVGGAKAQVRADSMAAAC